MEAMIVGFQAIFGDPFSIALLFFGVFMGIVFGCIPGLTAVLGVTLMIPFTYTMTPVQGLTLLVAIYVGGISGGLITATLINIPGTPSSIFTCYDGYPMAKSGKPGTALSIGVFASLIGGTFSALALFFLAPQLSKVSLIFGNWEYFAVALVGLAVVITMASNDLLKGLVGALIGIVLGSFGIDSISGVQRLTFGNWQLMNGLNSTALMMGLFAISEILHQCRDLSKEKKKIEVGKMSFLPPVKEMEGCMVPIVLGCLIGTGIGILPGIGQNASTLITYNQSKKGTFALNNRTFDLWILIVCGILAYVLTELGVDMAPVILGYILGPLVEKYFRMAMTAELGNFGGILQRPIAVVCLIVAILFLVLPLFSKKLRDRKNALNI